MTAIRGVPEPVLDLRGVHQKTTVPSYVLGKLSEAIL